MKWVLRIVSFLAGVFLLIPAFAQADAIVAQSYRANEQLSVGTLVSRPDAQSQTIVKADASNRQFILGVVVDPHDSLLTYNAADGTTPIATSGTVPINVSTVNGDVKSGDELTTSPIAGFAMKASTSGKVIGRAVDDFNSSTSGAQTREVQNSNGKTVKVAIGQTQVSVQNADWYTTATANPLIDNLQNAATQVIGKKVNAANAIIAALILTIAVLVSGIVLFSSVTSSIRSLGRNPLSHTVIRRSLTQVILLIVGLMVASVIVAFLIIGR